MPSFDQTKNLDAGQCFHCGQPVFKKFPAISLGETVDTCCVGCQLIVETIESLSLSNYYQLRDEQEVEAPSLDLARLLETQASRPQSAAQSNPFTLYDDEAFFERAPDQLITHDAAQGATPKSIPCELLSAWVHVENIHCSACVWLIENSLVQIEGVQELKVNLTDRRVRVVWDSGQIKLSEILLTLSKLGYDSKPLKLSDQDLWVKEENKRFLKSLALSGLGAMQVMMLSFSLYAGQFQGMAAEYRWLIQIACLVITTPVLLYSGRGFFSAAYHALIQKRVSMDLPISIALSIAYLSSVTNVYLGQGEIYFDAICMLIFFLTISRFFEIKTRQKSAGLFRQVYSQLPESCRRMCDGEVETITISKVDAGDILLIEPNEVIPVDAVICKGRTQVNEAVINGEFKNVRKNVGDRVLAGTRNGNYFINVRSELSADLSRLSQLEKLAQEAQYESSDQVLLAYKVASVFVVVLLCLTLVNAVYWFFVDKEMILLTCLAMLIASCPCALALAIPLANLLAKNKLLASGIVPLERLKWESLRNITDVVFDKTGTLTQGTYSIVGSESLRSTEKLPPGEDRAYGEDSKAWYLDVATALEKLSHHPISSAFSTHKTVLNLDALPNEQVGKGIEGIVNGVVYRLGSRTFVSELTDGQLLNQQTQTHKNIWNRDIKYADTKAVYLGDSSGLCQIFYLADAIKVDAKLMIERFKVLGISCHILSGDEQQQVSSAADVLGVQYANWDMSPEQKLAYIQALKKDGKKILAVGDGINDAAFIAAGDFGVSMRVSAGISQEQSDAILLIDALIPLVEMFSIEKLLNKKVKQNLIWALAYNITVLPLAAMGLLPPYLAAAGMSLSSLVVLLNSFGFSILWKKSNRRQGQAFPQSSVGVGI